MFLYLLLIYHVPILIIIEESYPAKNAIRTSESFKGLCCLRSGNYEIMKQRVTFHDDFTCPVQNPCELL